MTKNLTEGDPLKLILPFMVPLLIGNVFQQLYNIADIIIVGRTIGVNALAAVGATAPLFMMLVVLTMGLSNGFTVVTGQRYGAGDLDGVRRSVAMSTMLSLFFVLIMMLIATFALDPALAAMNVPEELFEDAKSYVLIISHGIIAMMGYNLLAGILRSLGDSKTPLYFLVFSSVLNIFLDILFIVPFHMGVAGAAWATILSQFLSALFSLLVGLKNFPVLHLHREDFHDIRGTISLHLKTGFPMGFQMSVMCIGQLAMQTVVNSLGTAAVAGYTAASKADQLSVLVNNAMMTAISNYVAQNFGAGKRERIRQGVRACLIQTETFNLIMCIGILLLRHPIVQMFLSDPTKEIYHYSDMYLTIVAPFYFILGLLAVYRTSIQSMQNGRAPFAACMIELVMRITATVGLSGMIGYTSVCIASPLAWIGACALLIPVYYKMMRKI